VTARSRRQLSRHDASTLSTKMSWSLAAPKTPGAEPRTYQLREKGTTSIVFVDAQGSLGVVPELHPGAHTELGRISK
jgi:hypothetical protein